MKKIDFGSNEDFIAKYEELKSSRKMGEFYGCDKTTILNHAKRIGYDISQNKQYKLKNEDKLYIIEHYNDMTSTELANHFNVSRGMITKIWYDNHCSGKENNNSKTTMIDITNQKFGKWTVLYPTDKRNTGGVIYWHCRCDCGTEKDVLGTSLRQGRSLSCGLHSNISKGNVKIAELLDEANISYTVEQKFPTCKDKKELPFDFFINNEYLIEYDGEQHFDKDSVFDYEYTHNHDLIKNEWCKNNNIPLIRIPYTHYNELCLEDLLLEKSQFIKIMPTKNCGIKLED